MLPGVYLPGRVLGLRPTSRVVGLGRYLFENAAWYPSQSAYMTPELTFYWPSTAKKWFPSEYADFKGSTCHLAQGQSCRRQTSLAFDRPGSKCKG